MRLRNRSLLAESLTRACVVQLADRDVDDLQFVAAAVDLGRGVCVVVDVLDDGVRQQPRAMASRWRRRPPRPVRTAGRCGRIDRQAHVADGLLGGGRHRVHHAGLEVDLHHGRGGRVSRRADEELLGHRVGQQFGGDAADLPLVHFAGEEEQAGGPHRADRGDAQLADLGGDALGVRIVKRRTHSDFDAVHHRYRGPFIVGRQST